MNKNCQQCRVHPALYKVPTLKGNGFRWKCEACYKRRVPSGIREKIA